MELKRLGSQTVRLICPPAIEGYASVVGKKEGEGPLRASFDYINEDTTFGESSWEKAEMHMQKDALIRASAKAKIPLDDIQYILAGDLVNQCIITSFGLRDFGRPFFGIYGACSTMAQGLSLAAMLIDGGFAENAAALTSSHFCSAERQFRLPLEYGGQRPPTAQWTATASGCVILRAEGEGPYVTHVTTGRIVDMGVKDANNMGAAMAPAAHDTIKAFLSDTGTKPSDYDMIVTGDLGFVGRDLLHELFARDGVKLSNLEDCGALIYDRESQDVHAGASGCGCSAAVLCGHLLNNMRAGRIKKLVFAGTGALLSPVSTQQSESIPSICHAVCIECR